ncbi:DUF951 domain-containing protein [Alicyclobacillaceae bacterium I2511]|nr:DUF951 domain-containing protein [Alicyclobacillaceae bacterium I2511]
MSLSYELYDVVQMKKPHACGENRWWIIRMGMDIRLKCLGCQHSVLLPRAKCDRAIRKILEHREGNHVD